MIKRNDLILIGAVLIICIAVFAFIHFTQKEGSKVMITIDGKLYDTLDLQKDTELTIKLDNGAFNTFKITNGYVDMIGASCPDKLCVKHKGIHYDHETIVCLPNRVVLEIVGGDENEVDMIAN